MTPHSPPSERFESLRLGYLAPFLLLLVFLVFYYILGPRIAAKGGLGFDGRVYSYLAQDFFGVLKEGGVLDHYVNRCLPSLVIFAATKALGIPLETPSDIYAAFFVYNSFLLFLGLCLWARIARLLALDIWVYLVGACALAANCQTLKMMPYYPMLTDTTAWFLGLASIYAYLKNKYFALLLCLVIAYFTWPIACGTLLLLLAFPSRSSVMRPMDPTARLLLVVASLVAAAVAYGYVAQYDGRSLQDPVLLASLTIALAYIALILWVSTSQGLPIGRENLSLKMFCGGFLALVLLTLIGKSVIAAYDLRPMQFNYVSYIAACLRRSSDKPGAFFFSHISYFGPAFLIFILFLGSIFQRCKKHGAGVCLALFLSLALALDSESRHLSFSYPVIVFSSCLVIRDLEKKKRLFCLFLLASMITSKLYLPMDIAESDFRPTDAFPAQWFFMNYGPWLSWPGFAVTLGVAALATVIVLVGFRVCLSKKRLFFGFFKESIR